MHVALANLEQTTRPISVEKYHCTDAKVGLSQHGLSISETKVHQHGHQTNQKSHGKPCCGDGLYPAPLFMLLVVEVGLVVENDSLSKAERLKGSKKFLFCDRIIVDSLISDQGHLQID